MAAGGFGVHPAQLSVGLLGHERDDDAGIDGTQDR